MILTLKFWRPNLAQISFYNNFPFLFRTILKKECIHSLVKLQHKLLLQWRNSPLPPKKDLASKENLTSKSKIHLFFTQKTHLKNQHLLIKAMPTLNNFNVILITLNQLNRNRKAPIWISYSLQRPYWKNEVNDWTLPRIIQVQVRYKRQSLLQRDAPRPIRMWKFALYPPSTDKRRFL